MIKWVGATAVFTFLVAFSAGILPWRDALGGAFRPPDFAQDVAAARLLAVNEDPYAVDFARTHAQVLGIEPDEGYPYLPHPPFAILLTRPFAGVPFGVAALYWFAVSLACCFVLAIILSGFAQHQASFRLPQLGDVISWFAVLLVWPPVLYNLEKGQFSILIAMLMGLAWIFLSRSDRRVGGICIGLAAALKIFPALIGLYLLFRRRRAAMWCVISALAATLVPLLSIGWRGVPEFIDQSSGNVSYWQTWPAVTYSLGGLAARLLVGSQWSVAITHAPTLANVAVMLSSLALVAIAVVVTLRHAHSQDSDDLLFAIWSVLLLPLNPLAMGHNGVLLALPIVLIGRSLASDPSTWLKVIWLAGCVLVSIPRQAIFQAASMPVTPLQSLTIVALPLWGTLLLFATGVSIANRHAMAHPSMHAEISTCSEQA